MTTRNEELWSLLKKPWTIRTIKENNDLGQLFLELRERIEALEVAHNAKWVRIQRILDLKDDPTLSSRESLVDIISEASNNYYYDDVRAGIRACAKWLSEQRKACACPEAITAIDLINWLNQEAETF